MTDASQHGERHPDLSVSRNTSNPENTGREPSVEASGVFLQCPDMSGSEPARLFSEEELKETTYVHAIRGILDQHHEYSPEGLMRYLERYHPEVEENHRFPLMIGATVGAQCVAQAHIFASYNFSSEDAQARQAVRNALGRISRWNFGLRGSARPTRQTDHSSSRHTESAPRFVPTSIVDSSLRFPYVELHDPIDLQQAASGLSFRDPSTERAPSSTSQRPPATTSAGSSFGPSLSGTSSHVSQEVRMAASARYRDLSARHTSPRLHGRGSRGRQHTSRHRGERQRASLTRDEYKHLMNEASHR